MGITLEEVERRWEEVRAGVSAGDESLAGEVVLVLRPVVGRICKAAAGPGVEVDDLVQEVLDRFLHRVETIEHGLLGWLRQTARNLVAEHHRRRKTQGQHAVRLATYQQSQQPSRIAEATLRETGAALRRLPAEQRALIVTRFIEGKPLREIAASTGSSISTCTRRIQDALDQLVSVMPSELQAYAGQEDTIEPAALDTAELRLFRDRDDLHAAAQFVSTASRSGSHEHGALPGRELIRVGVLVSHYATTVPQYQGFFQSFDQGVATLGNLSDPRIELVAVVEPDSLVRPNIEAVIRDYAVLGGMLDVTNTEDLKSLDLIHLGDTFAILPAALDAICEAVRSGVGLYNEAWLGSVVPGYTDRRVLDLLLTDRAGSYHVPEGHDLPRPGTVLREHPLIPGLAKGTKLTVGGCGPVYATKPDAVTIIKQDGYYQSNTYLDRGTVRGTIPVLVAGTLGRGRVVSLNQNTPEPIATHPALRGHFMSHVYSWLTRRC